MAAVSRNAGTGGPERAGCLNVDGCIPGEDGTDE